MRPIKIHLDEVTKGRLEAAAMRAGVSTSQFIVSLIREEVGTEWPPRAVELAGAWADLPEAKELTIGVVEDAPREKL